MFFGIGENDFLSNRNEFSFGRGIEKRNGIGNGVDEFVVNEFIIGGDEINRGIGSQLDDENLFGVGEEGRKGFKFGDEVGYLVFGIYGIGFRTIRIEIEADISEGSTIVDLNFGEFGCVEIHWKFLGVR